MKKIISKTKNHYQKSNLEFYLSLFGPFLMGTFHLVFVIIKFDWILLNYCIFFYLMLLFKVWQWLIEKYNIKPNHYLAGVISMLVILAPMMAAFVLTIRYKDAPQFFIDWFVYAYALYGTIRMFFAIKKLTKKEKTDKQFVLAFYSLIGALYTIQMMEFCLIKTFSKGEIDYSMYLMQLFTQGGIFLFSVFVIILFAYKSRILTKKKSYDGLA